MDFSCFKENPQVTGIALASIILPKLFFIVFFSLF